MLNFVLEGGEGNQEASNMASPATPHNEQEVENTHVYPMHFHSHRRGTEPFKEKARLLRASSCTAWQLPVPSVVFGRKCNTTNFELALSTLFSINCYFTYIFQFCRYKSICVE